MDITNRKEVNTDVLSERTHSQTTLYYTKQKTGKAALLSIGKSFLS